MTNKGLHLKMAPIAPIALMANMTNPTTIRIAAPLITLFPVIKLYVSETTMLYIPRDRATIPNT